MPGFSYGHFFYVLKPVSLRTAAYVGTYNAIVALLCGGDSSCCVASGSLQLVLSKIMQCHCLTEALLYE